MHRVTGPNTSYRKSILDTMGSSSEPYTNLCDLEDIIVAVRLGDPLRKLLGLQRQRPTID